MSSKLNLSLRLLKIKFNLRFLSRGKKVTKRLVFIYSFDQKPKNFSQIFFILLVSIIMRLA